MKEAAAGTQGWGYGLTASPAAQPHQEGSIRSRLLMVRMAERRKARQH